MLTSDYIQKDTLKPVVQVQNFSYAYADSDQYVLNDITLKIEQGECFCLTGPTGSGKSTLVLALKQMLPHGKHRGEIIFNDIDSSESFEVGIVLQNPETQLLCDTVGEEIAFGLENLCVDPDIMSVKIASALESVGLGGLEDCPVSQLSMGQKYRLILASLLAMDPCLLVLDEPGAQLDDPGLRKLTEIIGQLKREGKAFLLCEHNPLPFKEITDVYGHMADGTIVIDETYSSNIRGKIYEAGSLVADQSSNELISIQNLTYRYDAQKPVLNELDLTVQRGQRIVIGGNNGSGKSTLLRCMTGFLEQVSGSVSIKGSAPQPETIRGVIGYMFQNPQRQLFEDTVYDEISFSLSRMNTNKADKNKRVQEIMELCKINELADMSPFKLSYGQQHLVALASICAFEPEILLLDDPFAGLDSSRFAFILDVLYTISEEKGTAIVMTSHNSFEFHEWAHLNLILEEGSLVSFQS